MAAVLLLGLSALLAASAVTTAFLFSKVDRLEVVNKQFVRVIPVPGTTPEVRGEFKARVPGSFVW